MFIVSDVQNCCSVVNLNRTETLSATFKDDFCQNGKKIDIFFHFKSCFKEKDSSLPSTYPQQNESKHVTLNKSQLHLLSSRAWQGSWAGRAVVIPGEGRCVAVLCRATAAAGAMSRSPQCLQGLHLLVSAGTAP